jgi:hypothetical protein
VPYGSKIGVLLADGSTVHGRLGAVDRDSLQLLEHSKRIDLADVDQVSLRVTTDPPE